MSASVPIRIRFRYNLESGDLEFIVDDNESDRPEDYHDRVAEMIARFLARNPQIQDAGSIRYQLDHEWYVLTEAYNQTQRERRREDLHSG